MSVLPVAENGHHAQVILVDPNPTDTRYHSMEIGNCGQFTKEVLLRVSVLPVGQNGHQVPSRRYA